MAIAPKSSNIRRTYTLSAAALTVAALTLTGCGELSALTTPGAASDISVAASEAKSAPAEAPVLDAGSDDGKSTPAAGAEDPAAKDSDATAPVADEPGTAEAAATAAADKADTTQAAATVTADKADTTQAAVAVTADKADTTAAVTADKADTTQAAAAVTADESAEAVVAAAAATPAAEASAARASTSVAAAVTPAVAVQPQTAVEAKTAVQPQTATQPKTAVEAKTAVQPQAVAAASASTVAVQAAATPGSYKPTASNTGVPAGKTLKPYNTSGADLVITKDGTVLDGLDIYGDIKVRAKNVTIKNSRLRGGKGIPKHNTGIVDSTNSNVSNLVIQDNTIIPDRASYYRDGIVGHDYKALRNHIQGTNDGLGIFNRPGGPVTANVTAEGNYIHDLTFWSNDPAHRDGTHNDGIQVQGGQNIRIVGNNIVATSKPGPGSVPNPRGNKAGAGILLQQNVAKLANVTVNKNWVDGGLSSINIDHGKYSNITVTVSENRLGRNQYDFGNGSKYPVRIIKRSASSTPGLSTNRWADNLANLVEGKTGGIRYNS